MAVTKMEKVTIIAPKKNQDSLLKAIQGLQSVQMRDLQEQNNSNQWVDIYFPQQHADENLVSQWTNHLNDIEQAVTFIAHYGSSKEKVKKIKREETTIQELEAKIDQTFFFQELSNVQTLKNRWTDLHEEKKNLLASEDWLTKWGSLDVHPKQLHLQQFELILGTVSSQQFDELKQLFLQENIYYEVIDYGEKDRSLACVFPKNKVEIVQSAASQFGFTVIDYEFTEAPVVALAEVKQKLRTLITDEKYLVEQIGKMKQFVPKAQLMEELILAKIAREQVKKQLIHDKNLCVLQGWMALEDKSEFNRTLATELLAYDYYVVFEEPTASEIKNEVPTKLMNRTFVKPFEMLTEMYSLPKYNEIDPTPWMAPFYLVFFGMMVADIGYGLLMLLGTLALRKLRVLPRDTARFSQFFQYLSLPTILWGFVYGSFFGLTLPKHIGDISLPFPLLSPTEDVNKILILSVVFGFIQLLVGLYISGQEHLKRKEYLLAVSEGFAWQGILVGIVLAGIGRLLFSNQMITWLGVIVAILSAISILLTPIFMSKSKVKGLAKGAYNLYGITSYIGDLVSYTRLMALGISGGSIAAAFNMLVAFMPPAARYSVGLLLIILLHALNLFLTLLSAYVHGARLQYVEFFGKFYSGGGKPFTPLKTAEKYMNIQNNKLKERKNDD